jgi:hypothetical protein
MAETLEYDLSGQKGIEVWRNLPEGTKITLLNGAVGEITANPRDGGWVLVKFQQHPDASKVGEEEFVMFNEVKGATGRLGL